MPKKQRSKQQATKRNVTNSDGVLRREPDYASVEILDSKPTFELGVRILNDDQDHYQPTNEVWIFTFEQLEVLIEMLHDVRDEGLVLSELNRGGKKGRKYRDTLFDTSTGMKRTKWRATDVGRESNG